MGEPMNERDYVIASDLAKVRIMEMILRDIVEACNPCIAPVEYEIVKNALRLWRDKMFSAVEGKDCP